MKTKQLVSKFNAEPSAQNLAAVIDRYQNPKSDPAWTRAYIERHVFAHVTVVDTTPAKAEVPSEPKVRKAHPNKGRVLVGGPKDAEIRKAVWAEGFRGAEYHAECARRGAVTRKSAAVTTPAEVNA